MPRNPAAPISILLLAAAIAAGCVTLPTFHDLSTAVDPPAPAGYDGTFTGQMTDVQEAFHIARLGHRGTIFDRRPAGAPPPQKPWFVEFRARGAYTYGHASVAFGRLDRNGRIPVDRRGRLIPGMAEITGLHPSNATMAVGHVVPVPAMTTPTDGDHEDAYIHERFRVNLTDSEFMRVVALIRRRKNRSYLWHGVTKSCVTYVHDIAGDLGLVTPRPVYLPRKYIAELKALNS